MSNLNRWYEIQQYLRRTGEYDTGAIITLPDSLGSETRYYQAGDWYDEQFSGLFEALNLPRVTLDDLFPANEVSTDEVSK